MQLQPFSLESCILKNCELKPRGAGEGRGSLGVGQGIVCIPHPSWRPRSWSVLEPQPQALVGIQESFCYSMLSSCPCPDLHSPERMATTTGNQNPACRSLSVRVQAGKQTTLVISNKGTSLQGIGYNSERRAEETIGVSLPPVLQFPPAPHKCRNLK